MILLKQAVNRVKDNLIPEKSLIQIQNSFLFQLVFLSTIKDYIAGKVATPENLFIIPETAVKASKQQKKVLVLDMDQTLVYTRREVKPNHGNYITVESQDRRMYVQKRPLLDQFLAAVSTIFDVWIYTAVLDTIDLQGIIQKRFYRDSCRKANGTFIKDLKHLKRVVKTKSQLILVDDNKTSISKNYPFALQISQFEGIQQDQELPKTFKNLLKFYGCSN